MKLAAALRACAERALASGALEPIETEETRLEDGGVAFLVRRVSSLARKERVRRERAAAPAQGGHQPTRSEPKASEGHRDAIDPFDPPEPALTVADLSPSHVAVLNKFPVLADHLLIVTRRCVDQEELLDAADLAALALGLAEIDGLAFYNGGVLAGASQLHKHLQLVPLPLAAGEAGAPIEAVFEDGVGAEGPGRLSRLAFPHAFVRLADRAADSGETLLDAYYALLAAAGLHVVEGRASAPYNLLATRRWMLLVPRAQERFGTISVNALGFAGSLFVRDDAELTALRDAGPMAALRAVAAGEAAP